MGQIKSIADVDKNFETVTKIDKDDVKFYDASSGVFPLYGLVKGVPGEEFRRLPSAFSNSYGADCTVDACHPNDLGFAAMGETIIKVIENNKLI